jgi:hypothetical protein
MNQSVFISSGKDCVSFASCYLDKDTRMTSEMPMP